MKVLIVGGVAAGASTAARLRRLDETAEIIVFERTAHVSYANCGLPYHIGGIIRQRESLLVQTPEKLRATLNLDIRIQSEVIEIDSTNKTVRIHDIANESYYEESWDKLVLCPGGEPFKPPTPGDDHPLIFTLQNVKDMDAIKSIVDNDADTAVVIGGGFIGIEMTENLIEQCVHVDLVEKDNNILPFLDPEMARELECHMIRNSVRMHLSNSVVAYHDHGDSIACELESGVILKVDFVISAIGIKPSTKLAKMAGVTIGTRGGIQVNSLMQTSNPDIYAAGDAVEVMDFSTKKPTLLPLAGPANRQGRVIADNLCGRSSHFGSVQGTSILKVFDMTAAVTGANEKLLKAANVSYEKIFIHPSGHASYYPDTAVMHMKLLFSKENAKVLGAQIVGFDGVDKRIDVLAVAIKAGLTVYDLEELELAYAPPYGSAKDPVNMAGFVSANVLRNDAPTAHSEDYVNYQFNGCILDVRNESEHASWKIPDSINIPLDKLRENLHKLEKKIPTLVYCRSGVRSYLAVRILMQNGFNQVKTLSGGALTFVLHDHSICSGKRMHADTAYGQQQTFETISSTGKSYTVNALGCEFPEPFALLKNKIKEANIGDDILLQTTEHMMVSILPAWCHALGHLIVDINRTQEGIIIKIRKGINI
jgi:NADPH-dependent 2,4-dienoyl-CoA reductase/sulfur reductase-like enzyme/rhodanese-related sulfurtransferase/TusA-related sulfurtransferase